MVLLKPQLPVSWHLLYPFKTIWMTSYQHHLPRTSTIYLCVTILLLLASLQGQAPLTSAFCAPNHSALFPACERGLWQRNQGEAQRHHRGKSQLRTPINTLKAHAAVNTLITQWNAAISISAHRGWELINDFTPIEQTAWTVRNQTPNFNSHL